MAVMNVMISICALTLLVAAIHIVKGSLRETRVAIHYRRRIVVVSWS